MISATNDHDAKSRCPVRTSWNSRGRAIDTLPGLEPVEGDNIVTLQTCTLPDFEDYLLVQGELKDVSEG
jgi:hypothetical protein